VGGGSRPVRLDTAPGETARLHDEYKTLQELRRARELTQVEIARALNIRQASVAQMEKRSDLMISTLRGYIEGMGGTLNIRAPVAV